MKHVISVWPDSCGDLTPECSVSGCDPGLLAISGQDGGVTAELLLALQDVHRAAVNTSKPFELHAKTLAEIERRVGLCTMAKQGHDAAFIAAHDPTTMLRVYREAHSVLTAHTPDRSHIFWWCTGGHEDPDFPPWPCPEVEAVMDVWGPRE